MKIFIPDKNYDYEKMKMPIEKALEIMTDDWITKEQYAEQTIIDMRDCLKFLLAKK